ncbi:MAG: hypothetical protein ACM31E_04815, partial [Fibrobacterota bacterium]|nr:hypothetical protein [Chitinispirillaceae bacterium]
IVVMGYFAAFNDFLISSNSPVTEGIVTSMETTSSSVNDQMVIKYFFTFTTDKTGKISGHSFSEKEPYTEGQTVTIQYCKSNPHIAVIKGTRTGEIPAWIILIMAPFFLVGSIMSYFAIRGGLRHLHLITDGVMTKGKYLRRESTNVSINDRPVYKMFFSYKTPDGRSFEMFSKTHQPERLTDEAEEMLIYDPSIPEKAVAVDSLPPIVRRFFASKNSV